MKQIDTIIFDLGGVLIDWNPRYLYRKIFNTEAEIEFFLENIATMEWNEEQDGGRSLFEATEILLEKFPEYSEPIKAYYGRWIEMLGDSISGTVEILTHFKDHPDYRIYALTNWSAETFPHALDRFEFLSWFKGILVSGAENLKKPDPAIYELILSRYGLTANTCLFIDDNLRNVKAAETSGIKSIHYSNPKQLKSELKKMNLI